MILDRMIERHPKNIKTQTDACRFMWKLSQPPVNNAAKQAAIDAAWSDERKIHHTENFLKNDLFPHIGISSAYHKEKAFYLAYCIWLLLMKAVGFATYDSKDDYKHQRYDTNGIMHASLQRRCLTKFHARVDLALRTYIRDQIPIHWPTVFDDTW